MHNLYFNIIFSKTLIIFLRYLSCLDNSLYYVGWKSFPIKLQILIIKTQSFYYLVIVVLLELVFSPERHLGYNISTNRIRGLEFYQEKH